MYAPTYWTNPPPPFLPGSEKAYVPGWGANPAVAGPARVGVGALGQASAQAAPTTMVKMSPSLTMQKLVVASEEGDLPPDEQISTGMKIPWWYFLTGAVVLGAGAALAFNMGWVGR